MGAPPGVLPPPNDLRAGFDRGGRLVLSWQWEGPRESATFDVQRRPLDGDDPPAWEDVGSADALCTLAVENPPEGEWEYQVSARLGTGEASPPGRFACLNSLTHDLTSTFLLLPQPHARPAAVSPPRDATTADYERLALIGKGGMGAVWEARQFSLGRHVAIKQVHQEREHSPKAGYYLERFRREALLTARLRHPGIIPVHDFTLDETGRANLFAVGEATSPTSSVLPPTPPRHGSPRYHGTTVALFGTPKRGTSCLNFPPRVLVSSGSPATGHGWSSSTARARRTSSTRGRPRSGRG